MPNYKEEQEAAYYSRERFLERQQQEMHDSIKLQDALCAEARDVLVRFLEEGSFRVMAYTSATKTTGSSWQLSCIRAGVQTYISVTQGVCNPEDTD